MNSEKKIIVLDFGTSEIRIGFAGEKQPQIIIPATIESTNGFNPYQDTAVVSRWGRQFKYPIVLRYIEHWDSLVEILKLIFDEDLQVNPEECQIILTEPFFIQKDYYEKIAKFFFETFNIPAFTVSPQALLTLFQMNLSTGVVLDIGEGYTSIFPIFEGYEITHAIRRNEHSGRMITYLLRQFLRRRYPDLSFWKSLKILQDIKEKYCYIAKNYTRELQLAEKIRESVERQYKLPNDQFISLGTERFTAPEFLFNPSMVGLSEVELHIALVQSIMVCPREYQSELLDNIILTGGSSQLPGLSQRLYEGISRGPIFLPVRVRGRDPGHYQPPKDANITIIPHPKPSLSSWLGGSKFGTLLARKHNELDDTWITKEKYKQEGIKCVFQCIGNISQLINEQLNKSKLT